jgi:hypothetical protein
MQETALPTVTCGLVSLRNRDVLQLETAEVCLHAPLLPPCSHSSLLTLVHSFHLHLYSNFCFPLTFCMSHSHPCIFPYCSFGPSKVIGGEMLFGEIKPTQLINWGRRQRSWLRHCATTDRVFDSQWDHWIFQLTYSFSRTVRL